MLIFAPAVIFGLITVGSSALAVSLGLGPGERGQAAARNRAAVIVAVIAAVLCAIALFVGLGLLVVEGLAETSAQD